MRLVDHLRKAEKKGAMTIRRGVERAREEWSDVERRIRQRMRIYPQKDRTMAAAAPQGGSIATDLDGTPDNLRTIENPGKPIISVNGHDLDE